MSMRTVLFAAVAVSMALVSGCSDSGMSKMGLDLTQQAIAAAEASGYRHAAEGDGEVLHVYTWSDYISPDVLSSFEKALGVKVVVDTFDSNEAMYANLQAGGKSYDIIMPSSYQIVTMVREGMIDKLDHARLPNIRRNFDAAFAAQILDPSFEYSVPYAVTYTGFAYAKDKIPEGANVESWSILGNEALKGHVTLLDDMREVIGAGLMYLGCSVNSRNPAEIEAAVEQILKWRSNVSKFDAESYKVEVADGATWLGHGYSTDMIQIIVGDDAKGLPPRADIGFALPREGFSIAFDEMVVASGSQRKDLAYAFINYMYDGEVAAANMGYICGPMPVAPGLASLDDDYRSLIVLDDGQLRNGQVLRSFDGDPEVQDMYHRAWDLIKTME